MGYSLGLDIGIASVGWAAIDNEKGKLIDFGVRKFKQADEASTARLNRSSRRTIRRKKWRKNQLIKAFLDFNIIQKEEFNSIGREEYLNYYSKSDKLTVPNFQTVYHLRQHAIKNKISKREILLSLYNIAQARGHFILENIDFSKDGITFDSFKELFYEISNSLDICFAKDISRFETDVLSKLFYGFEGLKSFKSQLDENSYTLDEECEKKLFELCYALAGGTVDIKDLLNKDEECKFNIAKKKGQDGLNEIENKIIELYDICLVSKILSEGCEYPCDIDVNNFNEYSKILNQKEKLSKKEYEEKIKKFASINKGKKSIRSIKNIQHSYPNGLYLKECRAILKEQQKYYPEITNDFIDVCLFIISARIPYYVGPLGKDAKNGWSNIDTKFEYSYEYTKTKTNKINEAEIVKTWKEMMLSKCTYLPDEPVLPKGSLIGEVFSIINEINNYQAIDKNGEPYHLTKEDKYRLFDELFLLNNDVYLYQVETILNLSKFGSRKSNSLKFNNKITLYKNISTILPKLRLNSIEEIFTMPEKIREIEDIILNINLFDEKKSLEDYFVKYCNYDVEIAKKLSVLQSKSTYSLSKKIIAEIPMDKEGNSMLDILFSDNKIEVKNQQTILYNAIDKEGNHIDFLSNKYEKILSQNNNELSIDLIIEKGKPLMPISRPVIRALNETMKVFTGCLDLWGIPERIIIETANGDDSIKDFTEQNGSTMKHFDKVEKLYSYLEKQFQDNKNDSILRGSLEDFCEIESYYHKNKEKMELYIRQDGIDLLTGNPIDITSLDNYEIDHILPRGFGDDSIDDKMITLKEANILKGDRVPCEYISSKEFNYPNMNIEKYEKIVSKLYNLKLISNKKYERLMLRDQTDVEKFISQNLVDTRYIISEFMSILNAYIKVNSIDSKVVSLKGSFTSIFRNALKFRKDRDLGDQHHAYDAAILCITDRLLSQYYPNYDKRGNFLAYKNFLKSIDNHNDRKVERIVDCAFYKAYGQQRYVPGLGEATLLKELRSTTPLISWKIEKNCKDSLFDATLYKPKKENDKSALTILNVNNNRRSFDSVKPAAIDFYKINKTHYAVHIPYVIIKPNGLINKNDYIKLLKDYYKFDFLLNKDNTINEKAYRFRAFKNELLFDTFTNSPYIFNLGSIAHKSLEIKNLNIFSYDNIYTYGNQIAKNIIQQFKLKTRSNDYKNEFNEISKEALVGYAINNLKIFEKEICEETKQRLISLLSEEKNVYSFSNHLAYYLQIASFAYAPKNIDERMMPTANNNIIKKDKNAEYVKIKHSILGLRFSKNDNGTLIIEGPRNNNSLYKKIKHESFYWTLSKFDI